MAVPTVLPAEATPISSIKKRKHSQIIDLTADEDNATPLSRRPQPGPITDDPLNFDAYSEDDDVQTGNESDAKSEASYGSILDNIEAEPYRDDGTHGLSRIEIVQKLYAEASPEDFLHQMLNIEGISPRTLGIAFGLDPTTRANDDEGHLKLLHLLVRRVFFKRRKLAQYNTIDDAAELLKTRTNIMVITGAGISTSLGIPDFRSESTGFYDKIREMGYEQGEDVFNLENFDFDPRVFYTLAGEILPDQAKGFSPTHAFIRLLQDQGRLQTNYTQNIDNIEALAGIDRARIIQCHGSFATATCRKCKHKVDGSEIFEDIRAKRVAYCKRCNEDIAKAKASQNKASKSRKSDVYKPGDDSEDDDDDDDVHQPGVMKPDIIFFGEQLPESFFVRFTEHDSKETDLVIVIGTSLKVAPVSEMPHYLKDDIPHIYISLEPIEHIEFDIQLLGKCDDVVAELCKRAGWKLEHSMVSKDLDAEILPIPDETKATYRWMVLPKGQEAEESNDEESKASDQEAKLNQQTE